jgi:hypothetical protein
VVYQSANEFNRLSKVTVTAANKSDDSCKKPSEMHFAEAIEQTL